MNSPHISNKKNTRIDAIVIEEMSVPFVAVRVVIIAVLPSFHSKIPFHTFPLTQCLFWVFAALVGGFRTHQIANGMQPKINGRKFSRRLHLRASNTIF